MVGPLTPVPGLLPVPVSITRLLPPGADPDSAATSIRRDDGRADYCCCCFIVVDDAVAFLRLYVCVCVPSPFILIIILLLRCLATAAETVMLPCLGGDASHDVGRDAAVTLRSPALAPRVLLMCSSLVLRLPHDFETQLLRTVALNREVELGLPRLFLQVRTVLGAAWRTEWGDGSQRACV